MLRFACKKYVCVVQLTSRGESLYDPLDAVIHRLQGLEPLCHQGVSEPLMDGQHPLGVSQDPLFVRVGGEVIGGGVVRPGPEEHVLVLRSTVLRAMRGGVS